MKLSLHRRHGRQIDVVDSEVQAIRPLRMTKNQIDVFVDCKISPFLLAVVKIS